MLNNYLWDKKRMSDFLPIDSDGNITINGKTKKLTRKQIQALALADSPSTMKQIMDSTAFKDNFKKLKTPKIKEDDELEEVPIMIDTQGRLMTALDPKTMNVDQAVSKLNALKGINKNSQETKTPNPYVKTLIDSVNMQFLKNHLSVYKSVTDPNKTKNGLKITMEAAKRTYNEAGKSLTRDLFSRLFNAFTCSFGVATNGFTEEIVESIGKFFLRYINNYGLAFRPKGEFITLSGDKKSSHIASFNIIQGLFTNILEEPFTNICFTGPKAVEPVSDMEAAKKQVELDKADEFYDADEGEGEGLEQTIAEIDHAVKEQSDNSTLSSPVSSTSSDKSTDKKVNLSVNKTANDLDLNLSMGGAVWQSGWDPSMGIRRSELNEPVIQQGMASFYRPWASPVNKKLFGDDYMDKTHIIEGSGSRWYDIINTEIAKTGAGGPAKLLKK